VAQNHWKLWRESAFDLIDLRMADPARRNFYQDFLAIRAGVRQIGQMEGIILDG
jgi:hypothetical protein